MIGLLYMDEMYNFVGAVGLKTAQYKKKSGEM